jgi:hypothetical protein
VSAIRQAWIAFLLAALVTPAAAHHGVGTDLAGLNICLYGDCEARGTYVADPYGMYNPGVLTVGAAAHVPRGVIVSGSYYDLDIGGVDGDVGLGAVTLSHMPVVFQVVAAYAEARGAVRPLPGVDMSFRTRVVRLAAGIDAGRLFGLSGLSLGLAGVVPGTDSDLRLNAGGTTFVKSKETRQVELIPGVHWRTGEHDWFMIGAFLDVTSNDTMAQGLDPVSGGMLRRSGTLNSWFARTGVSLLPFVPLGLTEGGSPRAEWLRWIRVGADVEYRNISVPDETGEEATIAYFGADGPLLPDPLNPLAGWLRPWLLGGVDTRGGWGIGAGAYGRGWLAPLGCNVAWSSRLITRFLGDRVESFAVTCSVVVPL